MFIALCVFTIRRSVRSDMLTMGGTWRSQQSAHLAVHFKL